MWVWIGRGLLIVGVVAITIGLANVLAPSSVFPSGATDVSDFDLLMRYTHPWAPAPWVALAGGVLIALGGAILWSRRSTPGRST